MTTWILLVGIAAAGPESLPALDAATALDLGDHLLAKGEESAALEWYLIADYLGPATGGVEPDALGYRLGLGHEANGQYEAAIAAYERVHGDLAGQARLRAGISAFAIGSVSRAERHFSECAAMGGELGATASLVRGSLWLENGDLNKARAAFASLPAGHPQKVATDTLIQEVARPGLRRSPALAASLSVLPAVGQAWAKDPGAGRTLATWTAFAASAGFFGWWGIQKDAPLALGAAGALGTGMVVTWGGGIGRAYKAAENFNQKAEETERAYMRERTSAALPNLPRTPTPP